MMLEEIIAAPCENHTEKTHCIYKMEYLWVIKQLVLYNIE